MKKHYRFILIIGLVITFLSIFSGFPETVENVIEFISGIILLILAFIERYFVKAHEHDLDEPVFEESDQESVQIAENDYVAEEEGYKSNLLDSDEEE
ncbi:hypothetical protein H6775_01860 [Candidatus Nomurabacteria bacterium]|nr:hypothetical protein [Candidatus Nomurabacteria bacterium]